MNFRLSGQKVPMTTSVKYLGVILDHHLSWDKHMKQLIPKLSRATGMLAILRHYVPKQTLLNIYYAIFNSHLIYGSQIWGQETHEYIKKLSTLQNKALRIINFKPPRESANKLYLDTSIIKLEDQIKVSNCLIGFGYQNKMLPSSFNEFLTPVHLTHEHDTKSKNLKFKVNRTKTISWGSNSIKSKTISTWNRIIDKINVNIYNVSKSTFKKKLADHFSQKYKE